ncbi:pilus assembly protein Flp/PilA [Sphingobium wenxiniae]|uniref:Pilus assembly protein Flp/PilA n=1 Tax=Sphingobium wenxiniae (strain DSM 21828 / CGMCC 1.7748 / JZ-1) TaxID=595605 RepID=A0A562KNK0_SPHWJ|nr:Flp family type IVb pilin [Sphingobium wenxiniae]MBB6191884.1 pilus assembly protein Flp/PilA [Sphingobium wenxiniae]TWH96917.1 pilus assembly protein Flp/PilA [Sphingobium wenxiniae]
MQFIRKMLKNEEGATAIEYGLIAALIAVAAITAMTNLGSSIKNTFATAGASLDGASTKEQTAGTGTDHTSTGG